MTWWRRYRVSVPCRWQPLQSQKTGSWKAALGGITAQRENALNTRLYSYRLPLNCSGIPTSELKRHTPIPYPRPQPQASSL